MEQTQFRDAGCVADLFLHHINSRHLLSNLRAAAGLCALTVLVLVICETVILAADTSQITAIDVLLSPDEALVGSAQAANAKLRADNPDCFAFDARHIPHITVLQSYVCTADLNKVFAAVDSLVKTDQPTNWKLKATGFFSVPYNGQELMWISVEPTQQLLDFQKKLIATVAPYKVDAGGSSAFVPREDGQPIVQPTITFVSDYVDKYSGKNFNPHVTVGLAHEEFVKLLRAEPFTAVTFSPAGVSIYHLGEYGTAQQKLWPSATR
jgi:2'-5' RNA ligase